MPTEQTTGRLRKLIARPQTAIEDSWLLDPALSLAARGTIAVIYALLKGRTEPLAISDLARQPGIVLGDLLPALSQLERNGYVEIADHVLVYPEPDIDEPAPPVVTGGAVAGDGHTVYYLRRADGAIKIGYTKISVAARARVLVRRHGPLRQLATERGGWHREHELHAQFDSLRISPDEEWFRPGPALLAHVRSLIEAAH
jgi:hypothetical protein